MFRSREPDLNAEQAGFVVGTVSTQVSHASRRKGFWRIRDHCRPDADVLAEVFENETASFHEREGWPCVEGWSPYRAVRIIIDGGCEGGCKRIGWGMDSIYRLGTWIYGVRLCLCLLGELSWLAGGVEDGGGGDGDEWRWRRRPWEGSISCHLGQSHRTALQHRLSSHSPFVLP